MSKLSPLPNLTAPVTPAAAVQMLREGNARFVSGDVVGHDAHEAIRLTASGQTPFAAVVSCVDSRVPVETVFDLTIGHTFSARVAGNVIGPDILGSLEFAAVVAGSRLIVILGHTSCGAVKGACDHVELGSLTGLLRKIQPAVDGVGREPATETPSADAAYVDDVARLNVQNAMQDVLDQSDILRGLVDDGTVGLVGAMYDVGTGRVTFTDAPVAFVHGSAPAEASA